MDELGRLIYVGTITLADDEGRLQADPAIIHGRMCIGLRFTVEDVRAVLVELDRVGLLRIYQTTSEWIADHPRWKQYQNPKYRKDSKLPGFSADCPRLRDNSARNPANVLHGVVVGVGVGVGVVDKKKDLNLPVQKRTGAPNIHEGFKITETFRAWYATRYNRPHAQATKGQAARLMQLLRPVATNGNGVKEYAASPAAENFISACEVSFRASPPPWFLRNDPLTLEAVLKHWTEIWDRYVQKGQKLGIIGK